MNTKAHPPATFSIKHRAWLTKTNFEKHWTTHNDLRLEIYQKICVRKSPVNTGSKDRSGLNIVSYRLPFISGISHHQRGGDAFRSIRLLSPKYGNDRTSKGVVDFDVLSTRFKCISRSYF